jgi:DNA-directed RNA polymerase subunit omega
MARITVEDCQERVDNRFLLVQMAIKRVRQYREGYEPLIESRNKEVVTALREIAAGKVMPDDHTYYRPLQEGAVVEDD